MAKPLISRFVVYPLTSVVFIGIVFLTISYLAQRGRSFPSLPIGTYSGLLHHQSSEEPPITFFLERLASSNNMLVVIFRDGWTPQLLKLELPITESAVNAPQAFKPLVFTLPGDSITFTGSVQGTKAFGTAEMFSGHSFRWELQPISTSSALFGISEQLRADLHDWATAKATYRARKADLRKIESDISETTQRFAKLQTLVQQEELLKQRALSRKEALAKDLTGFIDIHHQQVEEIRKLVEELGVVNRVSKTGRAVEIARRISRRETKWYLANWSDEGDPNALSEYLAQNSRVDMVKLQESFSRALEVKKLLLERQSEITKIAELRSRHSPAPDPENIYEPKLPESNKAPSFWDRIF